MDKIEKLREQIKVLKVKQEELNNLLQGQLSFF